LNIDNKISLLLFLDTVYYMSPTSTILAHCCFEQHVVWLCRHWRQVCIQQTAGGV